jgi:phage minor structural protein
VSGDLIELFHDVRLDQSEVLGFTLPARSAKAYLVAEDVEFRWRGRTFYVDEIEDNREGERTTITTTCPALWYRLGDLTFVGSLMLDNVTPAAGLSTILDGTSWTAGPGTTSTTDGFSLEDHDKSRLALLREWAKITGRHLVFNTGEQTVDLVDERGADLGLGFRYRRNVKSVRRRRRPPEVTVLYPFGAEGLSIAGINGGLPYVEDFSFYTSQGMSLDDARARYTRSRVWSDSSFLRDVDLLPAAEARLAELAAGVVTYELRVLDLSSVTGISEQVQVGDTVRVQDPDFVSDLRTTVVRTIRYPYEPERDRVELAHIPNPLNDLNSGASRSDLAEEWVLFETHSVTERRIREGSTILGRLVLTTRPGAEWIVGYSLQGTGVGTGTITVEFTDDETGEPFWPSWQIGVAPGAQIRESFTFGNDDVPPDTYALVVRAFSSGAGIGLNIGDGGDEDPPDPSIEVWLETYGQTLLLTDIGS